MGRRTARITGTVVAIALGYFLFLQANDAWMNYWLLRDAEKGTAVVTKDHWSGHNAVKYRYVVHGKDFSGRGGRNWDDSHYTNAEVGQTSVVFYSASHPWISRLSMPRSTIEGIPIVLLALAVETMAVITVINPANSWALYLIRPDQKKCADSAV